LERILAEQYDFYVRSNLPTDMEEYFSVGWLPDDYWTSHVSNLPYEAGYAFCKFIAETYGNGIFKQIFVEAAKPQYIWHWQNDIPEIENYRGQSKLIVEAIKAVTASTVFQDFDTWFS
jgi:hypothetical protein